jgi:hypothetical protein
MPSKRKPRPIRKDGPFSEMELNSFLTMPEVEEVSTLSAEAWFTHHRDKIVQLSPRRYAVRLKHALFLE